MQEAYLKFNKDEIEVLLYIIGEWQDNKSDRVENVYYPNNSTTSTKLFSFFNAAFKELLNRKRDVS